MAFQLVYYSQQDPKWKQDILGFGTAEDTIGYVGCALTAVTMLLNGHGYNETPKTLNQKLKNVSGFAGAGIVWGAVGKIYPKVSLKAFIPCGNSDAPLSQIDAAIAAGQPAIVQVDRSPSEGIQTHWVVLYARKGNDYLMLDPWPYQTDITKEDLLMKRYAQGRTLQRAISHVILYEAYGSGGTTSTPQTTPTTATPTTGGPYARVKAEVTWGLNVRSSIDTSSTANIVVVTPAGSLLTLLEADGESKIGGVNQWVRVRTENGKEGFAAAWYLERVQTSTPAPAASTPATSSPTTAPTSSPNPQPAPTAPESSFYVVVNSKVGRLGAKIYETASQKAKVFATEPMKSQLTVIEDEKKARAKVGKESKWINVRTKSGVEGFVISTQVKLP
ncbi:MAG: SH3 domain-containing protein [Anaerolineales bacterium]|nr:SH3 domain-containing protein [Anaerolineales bacterium]